MPRKRTIQIPISGDDPERNVRVTLTQCEKGYYLGDLHILGTGHHIEAIQIDKDDNAVNDLYQNRLNRYSEFNEGLIPQTITVGRLTFFINIEAYAL